jgi:hypothetical protein
MENSVFIYEYNHQGICNAGLGSASEPSLFPSLISKTTQNDRSRLSQQISTKNAKY